MEKNLVEETTQEIQEPETSNAFGNTHLKINLAADMDEDFVERLSRFCKETVGKRES